MHDPDGSYNPVYVTFMTFLFKIKYSLAHILCSGQLTVSLRAYNVVVLPVLHTVLLHVLYKLQLYCLFFI